jgi:hypothetical protein
VDDAFSLTAEKMPRARRISPFGVRVGAGITVMTLLLATFVLFVVGQQRAADERRAAAMASQAAETAVGTPTLEPRAAIQATDRVVDDMVDARAQTAAAGALDAARELFATASIETATASALARWNNDVVFVDGPSTGPSVVSVFASAAGWSAAVQGAGRTCYWVAMSAEGNTRYGSGAPCTGIAALAADRPAW